MLTFTQGYFSPKSNHTKNHTLSKQAQYFSEILLEFQSNSFRVSVKLILNFSQIHLEFQSNSFRISVKFSEHFNRVESERGQNAKRPTAEKRRGEAGANDGGHPRTPVASAESVAEGRFARCGESPRLYRGHGPLRPWDIYKMDFRRATKEGRLA